MRGTSTFKFFPPNNHAGVTTFERLDQGHLHPKLEVPRLTCPGRESNLGLLGGGEHSRKETLEQVMDLEIKSRNAV